MRKNWIYFELSTLTLLLFGSVIFLTAAATAKIDYQRQVRNGPIGGLSAGFGLIVDSTGKLSVNTAVIQSVDNAEAGTDSYCRSTNGTSQYTCRLSNKALTVYTRGKLFTLDADVACSTACTLNIDNQGIKAIKSIADAAKDVPVRAGLSLVVYDDTVMRLLTP